MQCRILQLFLCIILLTFAESWWGRSNSGSSSRNTGSSSRTSVSTRRTTGSSSRTSVSTSRTTGSSSRTSVSTSRTTGSSSKATGWFSSRRSPGTTRRTTGFARKTTGTSRKSTGWFWRRRNQGTTRRTTGSTRKATGSLRKSTGPKNLNEKVVNIADNYLKENSTAWGKATTWNNKSGTTGKYKCNFFVGDVLKEAGVKFPSYSQKDSSPILANEWANPNSKLISETGMYEQVKLEDMKEGDIVAFKRNGESGHVGIVSKDGKFISAGSKKVFEMSVDDFRNNPKNKIVDTVVWRIKKKP